MTMQENNQEMKLEVTVKDFEIIKSILISIGLCVLLITLLFIIQIIHVDDKHAKIFIKLDRTDENIDKIQKNIALLTAIHVANTDMTKFNHEYNRELETKMCELQKKYFNNIEGKCYAPVLGEPGPPGPLGECIKSPPEKEEETPRGPRRPITDENFPEGEEPNEYPENRKKKSDLNMEKLLKKYNKKLMSKEVEKLIDNIEGLDFVTIKKDEL